MIFEEFGFEDPIISSMSMVRCSIICGMLYTLFHSQFALHSIAAVVLHVLDLAFALKTKSENHAPIKMLIFEQNTMNFARKIKFTFIYK